MRIPGNRASQVAAFFHSELEGIYPPEEIRAFIRLSFEDCLSIAPHQLIAAADIKLSESQLLKINAVVKGLKKGKPYQYITGFTTFFDLTLKTDQRALIPRQETWELVDWIIKDTANPQAVLDIGTGTGCIALALKKQFPACRVVACDVSADALALARENASHNHLEIETELWDVQEINPAGLPQFDVVVSNPPYILPSEAASMSSNVIDWEPHLALFTPPTDALYFYRLIIGHARSLLKAEGRLYFEVHEDHAGDVKELMQEQFKTVILRKDIHGKERMICGY